MGGRLQNDTKTFGDGCADLYLLRVGNDRKLVTSLTSKKTLYIGAFILGFMDVNSVF